MLETEFVKSLQCNYERVHLAEKPDDRRYQYCILTRGGIRGLLQCSLRYINGDAYLYYDITSKQNIAQLCGKQLLDRKWVSSFFQSLRQVRQEIGRFLLDEKNILIYPEHIFQDIGNKNFYFLYLPYSSEGNGIMKFLDFIIEHMDYEDEKLVECVYSIYEQADKDGELYLGDRIFEDVKQLEISEVPETGISVAGYTELTEDSREKTESFSDELTDRERVAFSKPLKLGLWEKLSGKKKKENGRRQEYREAMLEQMEGIAVAEEPAYDTEEYGQTVYMERPADRLDQHKLYTPDGRVAAVIDADTFLIGKQKEEVNLALEDNSVSRIHARIFAEEGRLYVEDLNSTNGTYKNGLRLQPYEKRRIGENDEICIGKVLFIFR